MPVSAMAMLTQPPAARARTVMRPPSGVNFTALDSRLSTICLSSAAVGAAGGCPARCRAVSVELLVVGARRTPRAWRRRGSGSSSTCSGSSRMRPASIFDMSRMSLMTSSRYWPLWWMSRQYSRYLSRAERAEHARLHDLGEADDGVERRAQLVAHIGEEFRLGLVGLLGAGLLLGVFLGEIGELLGLPLERLLRVAQVGDGRHQALLAFHQLFFVQLEGGDVGADRDVAAVLGAALADMQPAAVVELRLEGARARDLAFAGDLGAHDRLAAGRDHGFVGGVPAAIASSGRLCSSWKFELHSTRRFCASHSTKASGMVSMASRRRRSASTVRSTRVFCSVMSTAMPIRCGPPSPDCCTSSQRARSHTQLPLAWRMRKAWSIERGLGVGELGGELVEMDVLGMDERIDLAEAQQRRRAA